MLSKGKPIMKKSLQIALLMLLTAGATAAVLLPSTSLVSTETDPAQPAPAPALVPASATAAVSSASVLPAQPLVSGLPDFTRLVEEVAPAVVNIQVTLAASGGARTGQFHGQEQMPEFFRRFFGPGFPFPDEDGGNDGGDFPMPRARSLGSGFIISEDGYVLTNHHVVNRADTVTLTLSDRREFTAKLIGSDEQSDVALLKIEAETLPFLRAGNSDEVKPGQWAVAIGSPFGLDQSVTAGVVSAVQRATSNTQRYVPFIQTDVAINRGNSGGPLLNTRGEVIGINSQIFSNSGGYMGVSFAIPINVAMDVAEQLKTSGEVQRGQIGIVVSPVNSDAVAGFGLPDTHGALVVETTPGSAGEKAGLEPGDVIRAVDGVRIIQSSELPPLVGSKRPGTKVKLNVLRDGREREIEVTLTQLETGASSARASGDDADAAPTQSANPLGLVGQNLTAAQRRQLGLGDDEGVSLARIEGRAAREAGLRPGDVIVRVGRTRVGNVDALNRALSSVQPGQTVMLLVRSRLGGTQFVAVTLADEGN